MWDKTAFMNSSSLKKSTIKISISYQQTSFSPTNSPEIGQHLLTSPWTKVNAGNFQYLLPCSPIIIFEAQLSMLDKTKSDVSVLLFRTGRATADNTWDYKPIYFIYIYDSLSVSLSQNQQVCIAVWTRSHTHTHTHTHILRRSKIY
jgi:hypothetical protein